LLNIDYYSISEVTEYLNKKYEKFFFDNFTLLKQLLTYRIPAHTYGFGLTTYGSEFIFKNDLLKRNEKKFEYDKDSLSTILCEFLRSEGCKAGLFLELRHHDLVQIYMQKEAITYKFQDIVPFEYISNATNLREVIHEIWLETVSDYANEELLSLIQKKVDDVKKLFDNFDSVEEIVNTKDMQDFLINSQYLDVKPQIVEIKKNIDDLQNFCFFKITTEDIFILRRNLALLEKNLVGEEVYVEGFKAVAEITKSPKGKSMAKEKAQSAAKTLANYLWNQDNDHKIKVKEMAITVYGELSQTEHHAQLPDQLVSLKKWIEDIAPEYAREAGRPKEI